MNSKYQPELGGGGHSLGTSLLGGRGVDINGILEAKSLSDPPQQEPLSSDTLDLGINIATDICQPLARGTLR